MKTNITNGRQFKILWNFFARHSPEVEARGSEELLPEQKAALARLASGQSDRAEREKLIPFLRSNKHALKFLAEQIKLSRPGRSSVARARRRMSDSSTYDQKAGSS
jgi:hypothetical protein